MEWIPRLRKRKRKSNDAKGCPLKHTISLWNAAQMGNVEALTRVVRRPSFRPDSQNASRALLRCLRARDESCASVLMQHGAGLTTDAQIHGFFACFRRYALFNYLSPALVLPRLRQDFETCPKLDANVKLRAAVLWNILLDGDELCPLPDMEAANDLIFGHAQRLKDKKDKQQVVLFGDSVDITIVKHCSSIEQLEALATSGFEFRPAHLWAAVFHGIRPPLFGWISERVRSLHHSHWIVQLDPAQLDLDVTLGTRLDRDTDRMQRVRANFAQVAGDFTAANMKHWVLHEMLNIPDVIDLCIGVAPDIDEWTVPWWWRGDHRAIARFQQTLRARAKSLCGPVIMDHIQSQTPLIPPLARIVLSFVFEA